MSLSSSRHGKIKAIMQIKLVSNLCLLRFCDHIVLTHCHFCYMKLVCLSGRNAAVLPQHTFWAQLCLFTDAMCSGHAVKSKCYTVQVPFAYHDGYLSVHYEANKYQDIKLTPLQEEAVWYDSLRISVMLPVFRASPTLPVLALYCFMKADELYHPFHQSQTSMPHASVAEKCLTQCPNPNLAACLWACCPVLSDTRHSLCFATACCSVHAAPGHVLIMVHCILSLTVRQVTHPRSSCKLHIVQYTGLTAQCLTA